MTTLLDSRLSDRDFASHLLHVDDLLTWAKSKRLHLPTVPPIDVHQFLQVEALLSAIERDASNVTPEQALNIVLNDPVLKNDPVIQKYPDDIDPITCRWLLGAEAHRKWRELLSGAIAAGELTLLDFGSKLPVNIAPTENTATPAPVGAAEIDFALLATRAQLIAAFGAFTGMDDSWFTNLKDTPKLKDARKVAGSGGKESTEPLFCPFEVMQWLTDPKQKKGRKLTPYKGWQLLEGHFSKVYNQYSIGDNRTD